MLGFGLNKRWFCAACLFTAGVTVPAFGQGRSLMMLDQLQPGHWELRLRDTAGPVRSVCVHDGRELIQLRHPGPSCERYIVNDGDKDVTVQYTCRGRGYGRTHIRRESAQLAQIETQGIAEALPFNFVVEARRTGDCSA